MMFPTLQIMARLNFQGTVAGFFNSLDGDTRFYSNDTVIMKIVIYLGMLIWNSLKTIP